MLRFRPAFLWFCFGFAAVSVVVVYNSYNGGKEGVERIRVQLMDGEDKKNDEVNGKTWKLLLDFDCWSRLDQNKPCKEPISVGLFRNGSLKINQKRLTITHFIEQQNTQDFIWFHPAKKGDKARILTNFNWTIRSIPLESGHKISFSIPVDTLGFIRKWWKSEFIPCQGMDLKDRKEADKRRVIPLSAVRDVMAEFRDFIDENNKTAYLLGGSLLGWYRECSLIPHTTDLDYAMAASEHSDELEKLMESRFRLYWIQGVGNETDLITYHKNKVKTDLFFLFDHNTTHSYTNGFFVPEKREVRWLIPKVTRICSGSLLNTLMYVPCNVKEIILSDYGPNWMIDSPSRDYDFHRSGKNIIEGRRFNETEWQRVYRRKKGYYA